MKKTKAFARKAIFYIKEAFRLINEDGITVFAAQASFFVIISAIPFLSLLISATGALLPFVKINAFSGFSLPKSIESLIGAVLSEILEVPSIPLLSASAVTTLWTASRGIGAMRHGIETIYSIEHRSGYLRKRLRSLINTLIFIFLILILGIILIFGGFLIELIKDECLAEVLVTLRYPLSFSFMCAIFTLVYFSTARRGRVIYKSFSSHLPGAVFSAIGWTVFSYLYSLYLTHFPNSSYVYGSLGAVCLLMLWVYFCMIILLFGAEINKFICSLL